MGIVKLFMYFKGMNAHLFNIACAFILLGVLLILGHGQVNEICKKRLARDGHYDTPTYKTRKLAQIVARGASFISCVYLILCCYGIITDKYTTTINFTMFYRMSIETMILMIEYLTIVRIHKNIVDRTKKPRVSANYDILIAVIYSSLAVYIINAVREILNRYV